MIIKVRKRDFSYVKKMVAYICYARDFNIIFLGVGQRISSSSSGGEKELSFKQKTGQKYIIGLKRVLLVVRKH